MSMMPRLSVGKAVATEARGPSLFCDPTSPRPRRCSAHHALSSALTDVNSDDTQSLNRSASLLFQFCNVHRSDRAN
eukprot:6196889-Pleurochrysis_carterae.AAC.8